VFAGMVGSEWDLYAQAAIANGRKIAGVTTQDKIDVLVGCDTVCVKIWNNRSSIKHSRYEPHFPLVFFFFIIFGVEVGPVQSATVASGV